MGAARNSPREGKKGKEVVSGPSLSVLEASTTSMEVEPLPPLYERWLREVFGGQIPRETNATCNNCAMCPSGGRTIAPHASQFSPSVKCCSYFPELPNYIAGKILSSDDSAEGARSVLELIEQGTSITPLGIGRPPSAAVLYEKASGDAFGRVDSWRCPHYVTDSGRCGIWESRNSVCATWFCKHTRGRVGKGFWDDVREVLKVIEWELGLWCVEKLGLHVEAVRRALQYRRAGSAKALSAELTGRIDEDASRFAWKGWTRRKEEFFVASWDLVRDLSWPQVVQICSVELQLRAEIARDSYGRLVVPRIPERLSFQPVSTVPDSTSAFRVVTYSPHDPVVVAGEVMGILAYFDGRPVTEVTDELAESRGIELDPDLLQILYDFAILRDPDQSQ